jgi:hypothetical protein
MAKSRSESILRGAEIPRFTQNKLRNVNGFARGNRKMPGPGKKPDRISSPSKYLISSPLTGED